MDPLRSIACKSLVGRGDRAPTVGTSYGSLERRVRSRPMPHEASLVRRPDHI